MKLNWREWTRTLGVFGVALLLAGAVRYSIEGRFLLLNEILLIVGGVFFLAAMIFNFRAILVFFSRRSSKLGTNTAVMTLAVVAILGLVNFLGYRHHKRFDLTSEKLFTLSDQTRRIVGGLTKDVQVIRFAKSPDAQLRDLMGEYTGANHRVRYELVDPQERPEIAKQYGIARMGQVIVTSGNRTERLDDTNEQAITSAILKVTRDALKTICFVEGHGEKSITSNDPDGYNAVADELKKENYQVKSVNLVSSDSVPADCSVLVDAGPTKALFPQESAMLGKYLDDGGKALVLVDPDTDPKLDNVFQAWNIKVGDNTVIDASGVGRIFGTGPAVPLVTDYGNSPITRNFERTMSFFPLARTVSAADQAKLEPTDIELLKTSAASFAVKKLAGKEVRFDPAKDARGPLSLGVAAERKPGSEAGGKDARLVVIGDSDFAANQWVSLQRNGDLFFNAINWLAQDENLISIRPKSPTNRRINMTAAQEKALFWLGLAGLPGLVIAAGIFIWVKRR